MSFISVLFRSPRPLVLKWDCKCLNDSRSLEEIKTQVTRQDRISKNFSEYTFTIDGVIRLSFPGVVKTLQAWHSFSWYLETIILGATGICTLHVWNMIPQQLPWMVNAVRMSSVVCIGLVALSVVRLHQLHWAKIETMQKIGLDIESKLLNPVASFRKTVIENGLENYEQASKELTQNLNSIFKESSVRTMPAYNEFLTYNELEGSYVRKKISWIKSNEKDFSQNPYTFFSIQENEPEEFVKNQGLIKGLKDFVQSQKNRASEPDFKTNMPDFLNRKATQIYQEIEKIIPVLSQGGSSPDEEKFSNLFHTRLAAHPSYYDEELMQRQHNEAVANLIDHSLRDIKDGFSISSDFENSYKTRLTSCVVRAASKKIFAQENISVNEHSRYITWINECFNQIPTGRRVSQEFARSLLPKTD